MVRVRELLVLAACLNFFENDKSKPVDPNTHAAPSEKQQTFTKMANTLTRGFRPKLISYSPERFTN